MPGWIEFTTVIAIAVALLALVGVAAQRWGTDSRELDSASPETWIGGH